MPVSTGIARGRAVVVTSIDNVDVIMPGDILIARYTDVGWTVYFPLLQGIVTEVCTQHWPTES